jgi:hypothetical protein
MWKRLFHSAPGTSHVAEHKGCQDTCRVSELSVGEETILLAAVADGAGSAAFSDEGARLACEEFLSTAGEAIQGGLSLDTLAREAVAGWYQAIADALGRKAEALGTTPRELACTLLAAVVGEKAAVFAQLGDGGIVILEQDAYRPVFWPQHGEYCNTTNFVVNPLASDELQFQVIQGRIDEVSVFSDGLERLVLDFAGRAAHDGFFRPVFGALRAATADSASDLEAPFREFLESPRVNERTDDDKTLVLATRLSAHGTPSTA